MDCMPRRCGLGLEEPCVSEDTTCGRADRLTDEVRPSDRGNHAGVKWVGMHMDGDTPMPGREKHIRALYDQAHVEMSRAIGREYNNPLGEDALERVREVTGLAPGTRVLDIGAGRGHAAIHLAREYAAVTTAVELSPDMAAEARERTAAAGVSDRVRIIEGDFLTMPAPTRPFPVVLSFDTLCYFADTDTLLRRIESMSAADYFLAFTEYFCEVPDSAAVQSLVCRWKIHLKGDFLWYREILEGRGYEILHYEDTTSRYLNHWTQVCSRILERRDRLVGRWGLEAYRSFLHSAEVIINAVNERIYGHLFVIARRRPEVR